MAFRIPPEDCDRIAAALHARYAPRLRDERFAVTGRVEPGFVELAVALERLDRSQRYGMEFRAALAENRMGEEAARDLLLDFVGYYLDQYFEGGRDPLLPLDFQPYEMGSHVVYARGDVTFPLLDAEADRILDAGVPLPPARPRGQG